MYTLLIVIYISIGASSGGVSVTSQSIPGFISEDLCKQQAQKSVSKLATSISITGSGVGYDYPLIKNEVKWDCVQTR